MKGRNKGFRIFAIVLVIIIIAALVVTYVLAMTTNNPAAAAYGTEDVNGGGGMMMLDENGNPIPESPEAPKLPSLRITTAPPSALDVGQTVSLTYELLNAPPDTTATWSSNDPSIASVDEYGTVRAEAPGSTWIAITAGSLRDDIPVTVNEQGVQSVSIKIAELDASQGQTTFDIKAGAILHLSAQIDPPGAKFDGYKWTSPDNPDVATFDTVTHEFVATGAGNASVTVTAGGHSATVSFRITENENPLIAYVYKMLPYIIIAVAAIVVILVVIAILRHVYKARRREASERRKLKRERAERAQAERIAAAQAAAQAAQAAQAAARNGYGPEGGVPPSGQGVGAPPPRRASETIVYGQGVGASAQQRESDTIRLKEEPERPISLDDIEDMENKDKNG